MAKVIRWSHICGTLSFDRFRPLLVISFLCSISPAFTHAQSLLSFDREGKVFFITQRFEREHRYLGEDSLHDARIFQEADSSMRLVMTFADGDTYRVNERSLSAADLEHLRERYAMIVGTFVSARTIDAGTDNDGSSVFVQTFAGLGFSWYGLTLPAIVAPSDAGVIGMYLLTAGGCYFFADGYASGRSISAVQGSAFQYFATRGIAHGYALSGIAMGNDINHRVGVLFSTLTSLTEGFVMMGVAGRRNWSEGDVSAIGVYGDAGLVLGLAAGYLAGPGEKDVVRDLEGNTRRYSTAFSVMGLAGLYTGSLMSSSIAYTSGDAQVQEAIGFIGAAAGFTFADAAGASSTKAELWAITGGMLAGHAIGARIADVRDIDAEGARLVRLLSSGGLILGLGTAYIVAREGSDQTIYLVLATVGGGLGMVYGLGRVDDVAGEEVPRSFNFNVHPEGLLVPFSPLSHAGLVRNNPIVSCILRF